MHYPKQMRRDLLNEIINLKKPIRQFYRTVTRRRLGNIERRMEQQRLMRSLSPMMRELLQKFKSRPLSSDSSSSDSSSSDSSSSGSSSMVRRRLTTSNDSLSPLMRKRLREFE